MGAALGTATWMRGKESGSELTLTSWQDRRGPAGVRREVRAGRAAREVNIGPRDNT